MGVISFVGFPVVVRRRGGQAGRGGEKGVTRDSGMIPNSKTVWGVETAAWEMLPVWADHLLAGWTGPLRLLSSDPEVTHESRKQQLWS